MVKRIACLAAPLLLSLFCRGARPSYAETAAGLPAEAPSSLFEVELGGADAELLVQGSWEASLVAQAAIVAASGSDSDQSALQPLLFTQSPDLFLSFVLFKKYFVEARVLDDISEARYSFGYRGDETDTLKEVRIGNDKISFPELPFLSFGSGSYRSFGAQAKFETEGFQGHAMVRYDQATRTTKTFTGGSEITDTVIAAQNFVAGKWFYTAEGAAANLVVYVQSSSGTYTGTDGNKYRKLESGEYSYSATTGFVTLSRAAETRVAADYDERATADLSIGGHSCALFYDPDQTTSSIDPYRQVLCRYSSTADPDESEAFVRDTSSDLKDSDYEARVDENGFVEVTQTDHTAIDDDYARPFETEMSWLYVTDFSDDGPLDYAPAATKEIVVRTTSAVDSMTIDSDFIPGTVEVTRDGAPEYAFTVNSELSTVMLASSAGPYEVIKITYLRESSERKAGSLAAGLGGIWSLGEGRKVWTALGLRWAMPGLGYASADSSNPGSVTLTAGEEDKEGAFLHRAALAASYSRDETSGRYRVEGMEESGDYVTSFRPTSTSTVSGTFVAEETTDSLLAKKFPSLVNKLHSDGTTQQALRLTDSAAWDGVTMAKTVTCPPYDSFTSFSFFVMTSVSTGTVTVALDEGSGSSDKAVSVALPLSDCPAGEWRRIVVRYGDKNIYAQDEEDGDLVDIGDLAAFFDPSTTSSRLTIKVEDAEADQEVWIDEVLLEDSVGQAALILMGELSYENKELRVGKGKLPLVSGLSIKADTSAAFQDESYASGGASIASTLGPLGLKLRARGTASADGEASMSGGHEILLPTASFPVVVKDIFDFDPDTGAFGKEDSLTFTARGVASLALTQSAAWTPGSQAVLGILSQEWEGELSAVGDRFDLMATIANRARPSAGPDLLGSGYGDAWLRTFSYLLPAFESDSDRRKESLSLNASLRPDAEVLSASFSTTAEPESDDAGLRRDAVSIRLAIPLVAGGASIAPYYKRTWSDKRDGTGRDVAGDINLAVSDVADFEPLYASIPFYDLAAPSLLSEFETASADSSAATLAPETGIVFSREYGSAWYDLLLPASLAVAFRRELARSGDTITDSGIWEATLKAAAINLFGSMGAYPTSIPFQSDEYLVSITGSVTMIDGESSPRIKLQAQHLASFMSGESDKLEAENRVYVATTPSKREWSETLSLELTRRVQRHWLLDLYRIVIPGTPSSISHAEGEQNVQEEKRLSIVSRYLEDIAARKPNARNTFGLDAQVKRTVTDDEAYDPSWSLEEYYEAKLTVPERLTVSAKTEFSQEKDGEEETLTFGGSFTLSLTISF
jgi:hypothetical protein